MYGFALFALARQPNIPGAPQIAPEKRDLMRRGSSPSKSRAALRGFRVGLGTLVSAYRVWRALWALTGAGGADMGTLEAPTIQAAKGALSVTLTGNWGGGRRVGGGALSDVERSGMPDGRRRADQERDRFGGGRRRSSLVKREAGG